MYAEELCFAPKYERVRRLVHEGPSAKSTCEAAREALGPAQRLVLRRRAVGRRRDDGHGLPRLRMVSLDARRRTRREERLGRDGYGAAQGPHARRRQRGRGRRIRARRRRSRGRQLGEARRHGRSHRGLRHQRLQSRPICSAATPRSPTARRDTGTRSRRPGRRRAGRSRCSRRHSTRAIRRTAALHPVRARDTAPLVTGEDGARCSRCSMPHDASARTGQKVRLPFRPAVRKPVDLWNGPTGEPQS